MGAAFDSEAEIKGEIKSFKNKRIHAPRVATLIEKWDGCYIPSYEVAKYNLKQGDRVLLQACKSDKGKGVPYTCIKIYDKIYCAEKGEILDKIPKLEFLSEPKFVEVNYEEEIIKQLRTYPCLEFEMLWKKISGIKVKHADLNESQQKIYSAVDRALRKLVNSGKLFSIRVDRNEKGKQESASHTFYGRRSDGTILAELLNKIDPVLHKIDK